MSKETKASTTKQDRQDWKGRRVRLGAMSAITAGGLVVGLTSSTAAAPRIGPGRIGDGAVRSRHIQDGTIRGIDLRDNAVRMRKLAPGVRQRINAPGPRGPQGARGPAGPTGPRGAQGPSGLAGAYYAQAVYDLGNTNSGAIATVACSNPADIAISGGVQILGTNTSGGELPSGQARNTPVSNSFPGRMDWSTNTPLQGRLDGWIVQFGGGALAPETTTVWALCVPNANIPTTVTWMQSSGRSLP